MRLEAELDTGGDYSRTLTARKKEGKKKKGFHQAALKENLLSVSLFLCYAQLLWDSRIPRQAPHIRLCVRD